MVFGRLKWFDMGTDRKEQGSFRLKVRKVSWYGGILEPFSPLLRELYFETQILQRMAESIHLAGVLDTETMKCSHSQES